ncbi:MAG: hypothetical protein ABSG87_07020 [Verrucomicrobiota bacterium]
MKKQIPKTLLVLEIALIVSWLVFFVFYRLSKNNADTSGNYLLGIAWIFENITSILTLILFIISLFFLKSFRLVALIGLIISFGSVFLIEWP